jgi:hypothetical protein
MNKLFKKRVTYKNHHTIFTNKKEKLSVFLLIGKQKAYKFSRP